jgi:cation:H+ antiporter
MSPTLGAGTKNGHNVRVIISGIRQRALSAMVVACFAILFGFVVLIWSADLFVDGAASIAETMGLSPTFIGLTIVSVGTSAPEVLVSITAALSGVGELAIGNAIGSNIANVWLVLGVTLLVVPLVFSISCARQELPIMLVATAAVTLLLLDGELSALDGVLMLAALTYILIHMVRSQSGDPCLAEEADDEPLPHLKPPRAWMTFFAGLIMLIGSSHALVWGASIVASELGVSKMVIGLTVVAIGTSLPELAATIASALRGHAEIALGNIVGSNLFNLLAVMAIPGIVETEVLEPSVLTRDYPAMAAAMLMLALGVYMGRRLKAAPEGHAYIGRSVGTLFVSLYAMYYYWLYLTI